MLICWEVTKQGRIHDYSVAGGWAGAVMPKKLKWDRPTNRPTDQLTQWLIGCVAHDKNLGSTGECFSPYITKVRLSAFPNLLERSNIKIPL